MIGEIPTDETRTDIMIGLHEKVRLSCEEVIITNDGLMIWSMVIRQMATGRGGITNQYTELRKIDS